MRCRREFFEEVGRERMKENRILLYNKYKMLQNVSREEKLNIK